MACRPSLVAQECLKHELHEALKSIFPKVPSDFLFLETSSYLDQIDLNNNGQDESQVLDALVERLLHRAPLPETPKLDGVTANPSLQKPLSVRIDVEPQTRDVVDNCVKDELLDVLRKIFPDYDRHFLMTLIDQVVQNASGESRKMEVLVSRVLDLVDVPKEKKTGLKIFEAEDKTPDVLFPSQIGEPVTQPRLASTGPAFGPKFQCGCCFDHVQASLKVMCEQNHKFCQDCLIRYIQTVVTGEGNASFSCLAQDCSASFNLSLLTFVDANQIKLLEERIQLNEISRSMAAEGEELLKCPFCEFKCIVPTTNKVFECFNPKCMKSSCKSCNKDWENHFGIPCNEVIEKEAYEDIRKDTEEAMTRAKLRSCPKCTRTFLKEEGCNKMTCVCGAKQCYVCRKQVTDYDHFCQHMRDGNANCTECQKCFLFENTDRMDDNQVMTAQQEGVQKIIAKGLQGHVGRGSCANNDVLMKAATSVQACSSSVNLESAGPSGVDLDPGLGGFGLIDDGRRFYGNRPHPYVFRPPVVCFGCGQEGHRVNNCPTHKPSCHVCGDPNHFVRNCPQRSNNIQCFRCHNFGHVARDCNAIMHDDYGNGHMIYNRYSDSSDSDSDSD